MPRRFVRVWAWAVLAFLPGCAASISTHLSEPVRPDQPTEVSVLAVMPAAVEPGSEWIRPQTVERLVSALQESYPDVEIVGPAEAARRLEAESIAADWASLLGDFERAGIVDRERLRHVITRLEVSHILHIRAGYSGEGLQRATTNVDGSPLFYSTKHQTLYAVARLWGSSSGMPSWEAVAQSESEAGPLSRHRQPTDLIDSLVLSMVDRIPLRSR